MRVIVGAIAKIGAAREARVSVAVDGRMTRCNCPYVDHEAEFDHLVEELDPYHAFLRFGHTSASVEDPDEWRAEIRRQARRDRIPMWSFVLGRFPDGLYHVVAGKRRDPDIEELARSVARGSVQSEAAERAALRGHLIRGWIGVLDDQAATRCTRCGTRLFIDASTEPPTIDGDVFEVDCR